MIQNLPACPFPDWHFSYLLKKKVLGKVFCVSVSLNVLVAWILFFALYFY